MNVCHIVQTSFMQDCTACELVWQGLVVGCDGQHAPGEGEGLGSSPKNYDQK